MGTSGGYPVYNDRGTFYTALTEFTADGANARFQSDIVYTDDGEIEASSALAMRWLSTLIFPFIALSLVCAVWPSYRLFGICSRRVLGYIPFHWAHCTR